MVGVLLAKVLGRVDPCPHIRYRDVWLLGAAMLLVARASNSVSCLHQLRDLLLVVMQALQELSSGHLRPLPSFAQDL